MFKRVISFLGLVTLLVGSARGQIKTPEQIKTASRNELQNAVTSFREFLAIPNDGHYPDQINNNLTWVKTAFENRGFETKVIETPGAPHVFAERKFVKKGKTVLFYLQIDGQPVDPSAWNQDNPFVAELKEKDNDDWIKIEWDKLGKSFNPEWRIFARSASDSKGPAMCFLTALSILEKNKVEPNFNIKVIMDFQEEMSSPQLEWVVKNNTALLQADMVLIMDGTRHVSNLPTLTFGARGIATVTLKVFGPRNALHSGQYGNYAPNPVFAMSKLLAGMKDENGKVTIPGFYDGIELSDIDKEALKRIPENANEINKTLGIAKPESVGENYQEAMQYPTLNVRGLRSAWVGKEVRTIIPEEVIAEIDMRLVPESPGERLVGLLKQYVIQQGFHLVEGNPTDEERMMYPKLVSMTYGLGSAPFRTDLNTALGDWLSRSHQRLFGDNFVKMRTTGGSQPIAPFIQTLGIPAVSVRIPNPDNSIHSPNENIRLGNFLEGIETMVAVLTEKL